MFETATEHIVDIFPFCEDGEPHLSDVRVSVVPETYYSGTGCPTTFRVHYQSNYWTREEFTKLRAAFDRAFEIADAKNEER